MGILPLAAAATCFLTARCSLASESAGVTQNCSNARKPHLAVRRFLAAFKSAPRIKADIVCPRAPAPLWAIRHSASSIRKYRIGALPSAVRRRFRLRVSFAMRGSLRRSYLAFGRLLEAFKIASRINADMVCLPAFALLWMIIHSSSSIRNTRCGALPVRRAQDDHPMKPF